MKIKHALAILALFAAVAAAEGPVFQHKDPIAQQEFENVYKDLRGVSTTTGSSTLAGGATSYIQNTGTLQSATFHVTSGTVSGRFTAQNNDTAATIIANNANARGPHISLRTNGTTLGVVGSAGTVEGNSSQDVAIFAESPNAVRIYTDGSSTERVIVSAAGEITQPLQPSFCAFLSGTTANATGDNTSATVVFDAEQFDQSADFNPGTGVFTAPVTGRYLLSASVTLLQVTAVTHTDVLARLVTSNLSYYRIYSITAGSSVNWPVEVTVVADMDANDTASFVVEVDGGSKVVDFQGTGSQARSFFSGSLLN